MNEWKDLAEWYDKKQGEEGDLWHRALIDPVVICLLRNVKGKDLLDLGCGNGYPSRRLSRAGAKVTPIDSNPSIIRLAKNRDVGKRSQHRLQDFRRKQPLRAPRQ